MVACSWSSVFFLLLHSCLCNRLPAFTTPHPKALRDPTHISDFTDPNTGLNPFLDLQEGRPGGLGRRVMEGDQPVLWPPDFEIVEGGSEGRGGEDGPVNPRWFDDTDVVAKNDFDEPSILEAGRTSVETEGELSTDGRLPELTLNPVTPRNYDDDPKLVESSASESENPFSRNVMVSALTAGLVLLGLIVAFFWWRKRSKRSTSRPDVESANCQETNATKHNGNNSLVR